MKQDHSFTGLHNRQQRAYFEGTTKQTMLPADSPYVRRQVDEVVRLARIGPEDRVLEVGCGMGRYTLDLARRGLSVEGLDLSPLLLAKLQKFDGGRYAIPLYCADILDHPDELSGQFDVVVGFFTLHHLHDLPRCFEAMADLLRPGGRLVFLEPNPYNPLYYIQILAMPKMTWQGEKGLARMRRHIIFSAMEAAGLRAASLTRFGFFPPFLANRSWGSRLEPVLERVPIWRLFLPFQLFKAEQA